MERYLKISKYSISHTDLVRLIIISSLTFVCIVITTFSVSRNLGTIYAQLFYFPIIYATYFYPRKGLYLAGACAVLYETFAYAYLFPDTGGLIYVTIQALLFVCIGTLVAFVREKLNTSEARNLSIVEKSPIGIILFDQTDYSIRLSNTRLENMLGFSAEDLAGMTFPQLFSTAKDRQRFFEVIASGDEVTNFETAFLSRKQEPVWVNLSWIRITENLMSCTVVDINKFKLAKLAADEIDAQYKQVSDNLPTSIIITRNQMIVYINPSFSVFSGFGLDELLGRDPVILIHPDDREDFKKSCQAAETQSSPTVRSEMRILIKSEKIRFATLFFTRLMKDGFPAVLINLIDIPDRESTRERDQWEAKQKRGIISSFAYELRTPLQPIMGYINLLMQDPETYGVTEETRLILDRCAKSVDRENQIINQMLELSEIDTGKVSMEYSVFSLPDLLKTIIAAGKYGTQADMIVNIPSDLTFDADRKKIATIIETMLSNAVKYSTPPRKIQVIYRSASNDTMHHLSVRDNGIGITDARLDEIFEPFTMPESGGKNLKFDKIGLSLAIAKKYVKLHGGYISVDSIKGLETTFGVHIPKKRSEEI